MGDGNVAFPLILLIIMLTGGIISTMKVIGKNTQIFIHKNSKVGILVFRALFGVSDIYQKKSLSLLKNISKNFI